MSASIEEWWPRLSRETREYLVANNGDALSEAVIEEIGRAGGCVEGRWADEDSSDRLRLSDQAVDWVEAVANAENPEPTAHN